MKTAEVISFFGGTQATTAKSLGCDQSTVSDWAKAGHPPDNRQLQIERLTEGALRAEPGCLERVLKMTAKV